ncbi:Os10g0149900 [Oryza sativa Japonica Group]|uniref:Os10g0149900 protein n=1 Tax=Oryza sativa subsp. japonica TaxID=39947 RepID=A0A0P0XSI1_ORYSJ|nr:Os10g0149900 [Oryza sativa Japonica Group]
MLCLEREHKEDGLGPGGQAGHDARWVRVLCLAAAALRLERDSELVEPRPLSVQAGLAQGSAHLQGKGCMGGGRK